jgi:isopentenyldiphosphate isomerase
LTYLDHIRRCNSYDARRFLPFEIAGTEVGLVRDDIVRCLSEDSRDFEIAKRAIALKPGLADRDSRTDALTRAASLLVERGLVKKMRQETYPVMAQWGDEPLALIDRGAVPAFGVAAFGVHVNGYVGSGAKLRLWIGRRALDKMTEPGKLDNMVAGGQPFGLTLEQNLAKEADEEAGIPAALIAKAVPAGRLSYRMEAKSGLRADTLFIYDLEVPSDVTPRNNDGEISSFALMDVEEVADIVRTSRDFKFNVNLVIIDFLIRKGVITRETDADFDAIKAGLYPA